MKVIANRQLHSTVYGTLIPNEETELPNDIAQQLLKAKLVRLPSALTQLEPFSSPVEEKKPVDVPVKSGIRLEKPVLSKQTK